jgi:hypothetical protein
MAAAEGDWARSAEMLRRVVDADPEDFSVSIAVKCCIVDGLISFQAINNLSVALLSQGQLKEVSLFVVVICTA